MSDQDSQLAPDDPQPDDRFVTVRGVRLRYSDWGDSGPLMLLLHGDMRTARSWDAVARDLCDQFHVLSLDSRGHGDSDWPTTGYNFAERAKDLEAFCDALNLRNVLGVGHSTGGVVMSLLADTRRDIFERLTLLEPMVTVNEKFQRMVSTRATSPRRTWGSRPELYDYLKAHRMTGRWREDVIRDVVAHEAVETTGLLTLGSRASRQILLRVESAAVEPLVEQLREDLQNEFVQGLRGRVSIEQFAD